MSKTPPPAQESTALATLPAKALGRDVALVQVGMGAAIVPRNMAEAVEFAQLMAKAGPAVRPAFRGNPGMCLAVTMQACRWEMDPFAVAQKAYIVPDKGGNENIAYEAQLIAAVVNTRGPFDDRPWIDFEGSGQNLRAKVTATIRGEARPRTITTPKVADIGVKNSPLWKSDPEQQLSYYALRSFARRWCPEVLLGVYSDEEIAAAHPMLLPAPAAAAEAAEPKRAEYRNERGTPSDGLEVLDPDAQEEAEREADRLQRAQAGGFDAETGEIEEADSQPQGSPPAGVAGAGPEVQASTAAPAEPRQEFVPAAELSEDEKADLQAAEAAKAEAEAVKKCEEMAARYSEGLSGQKTLADLKDFAARAKQSIDTFEGVPAGVRGKLRGEFQQKVLERERYVNARAGRK